MRTIKFRAWDKDRKQMLPVSDISFGDDGKALTVIVQTAPKGQYYHGLVDGENGILMQFTGLLDKNGKEMYEGDIVESHQWWSSGEPYREAVEWDGDIIGFRPFCDYDVDCDGHPVAEQLSRMYEIIGSIYETPELSAQPTRRNR